MKVAPRSTPEQLAYLDVVRRGLRDTPKPFREELLADLRSRLGDLPADAPVTEVLGDASEYARLAREAGGYAPHAARPFEYMRALSRRTKVSIVAVLVFLLATTAITVGVTHYQPLRSDPFFGYSSEPTVDPLVPSDGQYWRYKEGATVVVGGGLHNSGRATVTVTGVSVPNASGPFTPVELRGNSR